LPGPFTPLLPPPYSLGDLTLGEYLAKTNERKTLISSAAKTGMFTVKLGNKKFPK